MINKKKIILFGNSSWYFFNFKIDLLNDLSKKYYIILIIPEDKYLKKFKNQFKIIKLNYKISNKINFLEPFTLLYKVYRVCKKIKPHLIINYTIKCNFYGIIIGKLLNIKIISNITGLGYSFLNDQFIFRIIKKIYFFLLKFSDLIILQNIHDYSYFKNIINKKKLRVIESSGIKITDIRTKNNHINKHKKFLMISRIIKEKGINEYLEAAKIVKKINPEVQFYLYGQANNDFLYEKVLSFHKKKIIFYGNFSNNISDIIKQCDCVVLPSYREGSSKTLLEASLYQKAIIASDVPGCNNIAINGINAILCNPKSIIDLVDAIKKFMTLDKAKIINMGREGRKHIIKNFDVNVINKKTLLEIKYILT